MLRGICACSDLGRITGSRGRSPRWPVPVWTWVPGQNRPAPISPTHRSIGINGRAAIRSALEWGELKIAEQVPQQIPGVTGTAGDQHALAGDRIPPLEARQDPNPQQKPKLAERPI